MGANVRPGYLHAQLPDRTRNSFQERHAILNALRPTQVADLCRFLNPFNNGIFCIGENPNNAGQGVATLTSHHPDDTLLKRSRGNRDGEFAQLGYR